MELLELLEAARLMRLLNFNIEKEEHMRITLLLHCWVTFDTNISESHGD